MKCVFHGYTLNKQTLSLESSVLCDYRLQLFGSVVRLNRFGLDGDGGVATLVKLRSVGDGSHDVAGTQSERGSQSRQRCDEDADDDFDDLLFVHNASVLIDDAKVL